MPIGDREHGSLDERPRIGRTTTYDGGLVAVFTSVTITALTSALDGLAARQRAIANNIANVNTPGYRAERVSFEDALARSVREGSGAVRATVERSLEPTQLNGNNVNLDTETLSNVDTVLRYQFAARAVEGSFTSVRTAMRTS